jgi:pimeloyl-ACP methyl ester carboxylesterase
VITGFVPRAVVLPATDSSGSAGLGALAGREVPVWFAAAITAPSDTGAVTVSGARISYRTWGEPGRPGVLLIHGGAAHAGWWDHIAPLLATGRRVVAIDLSGHGDSGHRDEYTLDVWADEVTAVIEAGRITSSPVLVGHSMGGHVAVHLATRPHSDVAGVITVDSPFETMPPDHQAAARRWAHGPVTLYPNRDAIVGRFRPVPVQEALPYVSIFIAENSVRQVDGGWRWKFDTLVFAAERMQACARRLDCRVAMLRAEFGIISPDHEEPFYDRDGQRVELIDIPHAGHAVMLDQPLALVTAFRTALTAWACRR